MIHFCSPYDPDKNIGKAYNHSASIVAEDDWLCFTDGDTMFPYPDYGTRLQTIIDKNPEYGLLTCYTNRVGDKRQCWEGVIQNHCNLSHLYRIAAEIAKKNGDTVVDLPPPLSGMLMLFPKKVWNDVKFKEEGILAVDNHFARGVTKAGYRIGLMTGFYIIHYYRLREGQAHKSHLL